MAEAHDDWINVTDVIGHLRKALLHAQREAEKEDGLKFGLEEVEVELQVVAARTRELEGGVGVKFWVVSADAKEKRGIRLEEMQKIRLKLKPQGRDGGNVLLSGDSVQRPVD